VTPQHELDRADFFQNLGNLFAGGARGAGSIGATAVAPYDMAKDAMAGKGLSLESNNLRRQAMDDGLQAMGAQPDSTLYKVGKLGGEVAGTLGAGPAVATAAKALPFVSPTVVNAIRTGGMSAGPAAPGFMAGVQNLATRGAGGAITGGTAAGMVDPQSAGLGAAIGGALPGLTQAAGAVGKSVGAGLRGSGVTPEVAALADRAKALGINVPADRIVNSRPLNAMAATLNYVPLSGRAGTEHAMSQQLNTALSRTFGQDSSNVTQALRAASGDLGGKFDRVLQSNTVKVDPQFMTELADATNKASRELGSDGASIISKQVDDIISKAGTGQIDGQAAYNIKRTLDRIGNRNSPESFYARELKKALMGALDRSLGPQEAQAFAGLRRQYGNMLALENLAQNGAEGGISAARLGNMKNIGNPDLQELADISAQFLKTRESPHGAMQRLMIGGVASTAGGVGALPYIGATAAAGRVANTALNSDTLRSIVMRQPGAQQNALMRFLNDPRLQELSYQAAPVLGTAGGR
jgi:hypothetical protein